MVEEVMCVRRVPLLLAALVAAALNPLKETNR